MNTRIAKTLVLAVIFAIGIAEYTAETKYYNGNNEISEEVYRIHQETNSIPDRWASGHGTSILEKKVYNPTFIFLGLLGGLGLGYLLAGSRSDKKQD